MQTLYIDVFFLINFTIDILAAFFSACFNHIRTNVKRLILSGVLGAGFAIADLFIGSGAALRIFLSVSFLIILAIICAKGISTVRRAKFIILFIIFQLVIGGIVSFLYSQLELVYRRYGESFIGGAENRKLLIFSVIILLSIGVFKMFILLYSHTASEKSVRIGIKIGDVYVEEDALIDTGNLVRDPMNMSPVLFVKEDFARLFLPRNVIELTNIDALEPKYRKRIRLIPVTRANQTHVMTGIRVDSIGVCSKGGFEPFELTVAIDKEGGTFGGYMALAPSVLSDYADKADKGNCE